MPPKKKATPKKTTARKDVAPKIPGKQVANPVGKGKRNPPGACPTGYVWDAANRRCVKRSGTTTKPKGNCPPGYKWDGFRGRCVRDKSAPTAKTCPPGSHWAEDVQRCVSGNPAAVDCGPGKVWDDARGRCVATDEAKHGCPAGSYWDAKRGVCIEGTRPEEGPPVDCPEGTVWNGFMCVRDTGEEEAGEVDEAHPCGEGTVWNEDLQMCVPGSEDNAKERQNILDLLANFLRENELPSTLLGFIQNALTQGKSYAQIIAELRQTPEYKAAYPENELRAAQGFSWMPEAHIRAYRNDARRIARSALGLDISNREISGLIAGDVSLAEWENRLQTWKKFEQFGPTVRSVLESELGTRISDDRVFAFLSSSIPTPELDRAYENALYRGRPAMLGLGIRPEEEANLLRRYGIDVDQAFRGYQGIVGEMPRAERFAFIERAINGNQALPANGSTLFNDTPFATLFRAIQLGDADAIRILQDQMSREVARSAQGGGTVFAGGVAAGLMTAADRAQL